MLSSIYLSLGSPELDQKTLELARDQLKNLRDGNFHWLLGCTFAVGVGLLLELPEIIHDLCEIYGRKTRELKFWLSLPMDRKEYPHRDWVKKWSALGSVLIVIGVMGEGWFESQVSKYDSALSKMTDTVVAQASEESNKAEVIASGFDAQIAASDAKAKSAEATAKQFEAQIAEANKEATDAKLELAKFKAPRELDTKQRDRVTAKCKSFPRTPFILLVNPDPESIHLLGVLEDILVSSCAWNLQKDDVFGFAVPTPKGNSVRMVWGAIGVHVLFSSEMNSTLGQTGRELANALAAEGITAQAGINATAEKNALYILIGQKP